MFSRPLSANDVGSVRCKHGLGCMQPARQSPPLGVCIARPAPLLLQPSAANIYRTWFSPWLGVAKDLPHAGCNMLDSVPGCGACRCTGMVAASGVLTCIVAASFSLWRMSPSSFWSPSMLPSGFQWYDCGEDQVNPGLVAFVSAVLGRCGCTVTI